MKINIKNFFYGIIIGASMIIPGLSGGTTAILLGIYDKLINATADLTSKVKFKSSGKLLCIVGMGALIGFYLFSKLILHALETFYYPLMFLFIGLVFASLPTLFKKAQIKSFAFSDFIFTFTGFLICIAFMLIPDNFTLLNFNNEFLNFLLIILSGFIIAIALILPGLSVSQMLLLLGLYTTTLDSIANLNFKFLIPFGLSVTAGCILSSNILNHFLKEYPKKSYNIIIGFVAGSIFEMVPTNCNHNIGIALIFLFIGLIFTAITNKVIVHCKCNVQ